LIDNKSIFIIIPCYNEARVIRKTVAEVLEKGYSVVVVDDWSKDGSKMNTQQEKDLGTGMV